MILKVRSFIVWRALISVVLATYLVIAAAPSLGSDDDAGDDATASSAVFTARSPARSFHAHGFRRRQNRSDLCRAEVSAHTIDLAADYLRSRAAKQNPSADALSAWLEFYAGCDSRIRIFTRQWLRTSADIDDCAQEVWAELARKLPAFQFDRARGSFETWVYSLVRSKAVNLIRMRSRFSAGGVPGELADQTDGRRTDPSEICADEEELAWVRQLVDSAINDASEKGRQLFRMRWIEGRDVSETAQALGMTCEQVWSRERRMKGKVRMELARRRRPRVQSSRQ